MPDRPWKHGNVGAPDAQLDAAVAAHKEQETANRERRASEVKRLLSDAELQAWRYAERRTREYQRWFKVRGRWVRLTVVNKSHTGTAAVNEGSLKALRTTLPEDDKDALGGLPQRPSPAWLRRIDQNAATDQGRTETAEHRKREAIAWAEGVDNSTPEIPARRGYKDPSRNDDGNGSD